MIFTDQKQRIATDHDVKAPWGCGKPGEFFRCALCGYKFNVGDRWRWVFTNDHPGAWGNPLVCEKCDGTREDIIEKWRTMHEEAKTKYWWFTRDR